MLKFLTNRLLISIPTLIAISLVLFAVLSLAPGDPLGEMAASPYITAEVRENLRRSLGLDQPTHIRYIKWVAAFVRGDMGYSFASRSPVIDLIKQRLPVTLLVVGSSYLLGSVIAIPIGVFAAYKHHSFWDQATTFIAFLGFSLPTFFTGVLALLIFSIRLKWFPLLYDSILLINDWNSFQLLLTQITLPILVLAFWQAAVLTRYVRSAVLDNIYLDYVRTAHSKGLRKYVIVNRHILRNALIPVVTLIALGVPTVFAGAMVTEQVFSVPGIGNLLIWSIVKNDTPVILGITFVYAILVVIFNTIADILYGFLDPRVSFEGLSD